MQRIIAVYILLLAGMLSMTGQTPEERYTRAGELYGSGDYSGAAAIYRQLYDEGYRSEDLLFNAGNAFFKSGDNASAILFYERAKLFAPADEDVDYNLQIA
ncbi:MAG: competence protein, partial [Bacteroidales bacterium]|nr:competence protein [Bacteroidales bacterium]